MAITKAFHKNKLILLFFILFSAVFILTLMFGLDCVHADSEDNRNYSYSISTVEDLVQIAEDVNNGLYDGYYGVCLTLANDIDMASLFTVSENYLSWTPIGTSTYPFKGVFDGAGHVIKGLKINGSSADRIGLFGETSVSAVIRNVSVYGSVYGGNYTSGIVGYNNGQIVGCRNYVNISAKSDALHVGGVTAYNTGSVIDSSNSGAVNIGFATFVGGIAGSNYGVIENCYNEAQLSSVASIIGGIVGQNCANADVACAFNNGDINGKSTIGGIAGNNQGNISNVLNSGLINSDNGTAAGIVGSNEITGRISFSLNTSVVCGLVDIAAICGYNSGVVERGFFDNTVYTGSVVNGIAAENSMGLPTRILMHSDVLDNTEKLESLITGNLNQWIKRDSVGTECYYPELKYFYDNYDSPSKSAVSINRMEISQSEISLSETAFTYNGHQRNVDIYYNAIKLEEGQDYIAAYTNNVNAGVADVEITFINGFLGTVTKTFIINQSELTVEWNNLLFTYSGLDQAPVLNVLSGLIDNESVVFKYTRQLSINVGIYDIKAELENTVVNANYYLDETNGTYEIEKSDISIEWSQETFYYNGLVQYHTAFVSAGQCADDEIIFIYDYEDNVSAGQQTITVYLADNEVNKNYNFGGEMHTYVIQNQPITVFWSDEYEDLYYNGIAQHPTAMVLSGQIGEENIVFSYSGYEKNINANEDDGYYVSLTLADTVINSNYYLEPILHKYFIRKNPITIEWWDVPLYYMGDAQCPSFYIVSGKIGDDEIIFDISDYSDNINASVGNSYQIEISLADNIVNKNYSFVPIIKTYDIHKATYDPFNSIEFRSQTFDLDGQPKSIFIVGTLPKGITVAYLNNGQKEAGEYLVSAVFTVDASNYNELLANTLTAKMYIAPMLYDDLKSGITAKNMGSAVYGLTLDVDKLADSSQFERKKKEILLAYRITFIDEIVEISVPLLGKQLDRSGIMVLYKNLRGEIVVADYKISDGKLIFTAEDITEFAILANSSLLLLWILLGVGLFILISGIVIAIIIIKKRKILHVTRTVNDEESMASELCCSRQEISKVESQIPQSDDFGIKLRQSVDVVNNVEFVLDGVYCVSYEWFINSLRFKTISKQKSICGGNANALQLIEARPQKSVYWLGKRYKINSRAYMDLINRAREATHEKN